MAYIGRQNLGGAYRQLDDISSGFDGSDTTHTMQVNSQNVTVGDVNQIILSLGGVIQKPGTDFTVSGSVLTFTTAPAANTSFFAVLLGSDNGGTVTPTDGSVTSDKLAYPFVVNEDGAAASDFRVESDSNTHMLFVDAGNNKIGINTSSPDDALHVKGNLFLEDSSPEITLETTNSSHYNWQIAAQENVANSFEIAVGSADADASNDSFTSTLLINSAGQITKPLQPMASARPTNAVTNITGDGTLAYLGNSIGATERFDVGGCFSNDGMLFIAPVTGKYLLCGQLIFSGLASNHTLSYFMLSTSNQSYYPFYGAELDTVGYLGSFGSAFSVIADMDANDSAQLAMQVYGGSKVVDASTSTFLTGMLLA